jgi:hypothetical protein
MYLRVMHYAFPVVIIFKYTQHKNNNKSFQLRLYGSRQYVGLEHVAANISKLCDALT